MPDVRRKENERTTATHLASEQIRKNKSESVSKGGGNESKRSDLSDEQRLHGEESECKCRHMKEGKDLNIRE